MFIYICIYRYIATHTATQPSTHCNTHYNTLTCLSHSTLCHPRWSRAKWGQGGESIESTCFWLGVVVGFIQLMH